MANPFSQLRQGVMTQVGLVTGVKWVERARGVTTEAALAHLAAQGGNGCFVRVVGGAKDQAGWQQYDDAETLVQILVCSANLRSRAEAGDDDEELLWSVYKGLRDSKCSLAWLQIGLQYRDWELMGESPQGSVFSLIMATRFDMNAWTV